MNAVLAKNVRIIREKKHWTQQHLAEAAGIQLRTVQRVESGDGASVETLSALAGAFNTVIEVLQTDWDSVFQQAEQQQQELKKTHHIIEMKPVKSSADLQVIGGAGGGQYECLSTDDAVQDAFAELQSNMHDTIELWDDVDPMARRGFVRDLYEQVQKLEKLGMVVTTGTRETKFGGIPITVLYVVA